MQFNKVQTDIIPLVGGVDMVTTPIMLSPGKCIFAQNFEPDINGGYRRMRGVERFDGRPRPSDAEYAVLDCLITGPLVVGDAIVGVSSGASAVVAFIASSTRMVVTKLQKSFSIEAFSVGAVEYGSISSEMVSGALSNQEHAQFKNAAADIYRADIGAVPGSGPVRGVKYYKGSVYAFRDNADATACVMYRQSAFGWTEIQFGRELRFDGAVGEITEGQTVTGLTSGATGVVKRALLRTGTWTVSGVGTLVFDSITGLFQDNEAIQVGGVTKVTANGADLAISLLPGGKFEFDIVNFQGNVEASRMYCVDGVNKMGEFDGVRWIPIRTGVGSDNPKFVVGHKKQLICAIESEIIVSGIGSPYSFTALTGAAQIATGETITGLKAQVGDPTNGVLVVATERKIYMLYGNDLTDYILSAHSPDSGAVAYTLQNIGFAHYFDVRGLTQLMASQAYGSFQSHILTQSVQPYVDDKAGKVIASTVVRNQNLYRIYFNDGSGLNIQIKPNGNSNAPAIGDIMPFDYGSRVMHALDSVIDVAGKERKFGACSDGYVYEIDIGTSFDGDPINAFAVLAFNHSKSTDTQKNYKRAKLLFDAGTTAHLNVSYDLSFGNFDASYGVVSSQTITGSGGYWDSSSWDSIFWDAAYAQEITIDTPGNGTSISINISNESDIDESFVINAVKLQYSPGRLMR
jgi:hypothetical protein